MNLPLNIALTGVKAGLDIAAKASKPGDGKDALQNVFASLLALVTQATGKAAANPGETGSSTQIVQTAQNWLQAQLGGSKISLDGKTINIDGKPVDAKNLLAQLGEGKITLDGKTINIDGKPVNAINLLAQLLGGAENLNILGAIGQIGVEAASGQFAKMLQSSGAYQAMMKASASVSSLINSLPATSAAQAVSDKAVATVFADNAKAANKADIAGAKAATTTPAKQGGAQLSKAQLTQLALPAASPAAALSAKPETGQQSVNFLLTALAQNQNTASPGKQGPVNNQAGQTPATANQVAQAASTASPNAPQILQANTLAAQIQNQFSSIAEIKPGKKVPAGLAPQTANSFKPGVNPANPAIAPFQILQAKAIAANNSDSKVLTPSDIEVDGDIGTKTLPSAASMAQAGANANKAQISAFSPVQTGFQAPQINLPNVAFEIARNFNGGNNRFQIRLDPPELGRIDVRLEVKKDGAVNARLTVDRQDTLDLLQRDARTLQRALVQAGLDSSQTNLEFSLKQNPFAGQGFSNGNSSPQFNNSATPGTGETATPPDQVISAYSGYISPGGVSLWV